jgi:hypothetical protein
MLPLGAPCDPSVAGQCANGAACYAVNSMLIPSCGNFQATCTSDSQVSQAAEPPFSSLFQLEGHILSFVTYLNVSNKS